MAISDLLSAIPWIVGSAAVPVYNPDGTPAGVYGAHGNEDVCSLQGTNHTLLRVMYIWYVFSFLCCSDNVITTLSFT
jgi:hypothetical protein